MFGGGFTPENRRTSEHVHILSIYAVYKDNKYKKLDIDVTQQIPVSYTHLDVYKRQGHILRLNIPVCFLCILQQEYAIWNETMMQPFLPVRRVL